MKEINISKNITNLRNKKGITQDQLATALNISPQAVSKWETNTSQPDTQMLPLIAEYFDVSIDYLYYGDDYVYSDIYNKVYEKVNSHSQMSEESYKEAFTIHANAHHGICRMGKKNDIVEEPYHIVNENGLSLISGRGYSALLTRDFFKYIDKGTVELAEKILPSLAKKNNILVCLAIISMSDISIIELQEKVGLDDNTLREALDELITTNIVIEKQSKHKSLGFTYEICDMYHTCLCLIFATLEMQRFSLNGISCCMGFGDYPVNI